MLDVRFIMNSAVEEIFSFKTCCGLMRMFDQNLEIHLRNKGSQPLLIFNYFDLVGQQGSTREDSLTPPGTHHIMPGEILAVYCAMDPVVWDTSRVAVFYDSEGAKYPIVIVH
jgi:hypothetical protein